MPLASTTLPVRSSTSSPPSVKTCVTLYLFAVEMFAA